MAGDPNMLRLLIATDNHLGVHEEDPIRKDDSFTAFEEILAHAVRTKVDALLLGGDIFHENKPSRPTVVRTIELLRKYCMNDNPVHFQVVSDQAANFSRNSRVNYEDENYNVGLPVFIIHGNHDEPAGTDNLSAVDILAACNLVNYYGKLGMSGQGAGKCSIAPVLLKKGDTLLALYGLGYMRDARLYRMMVTPGEVSWKRPADHEADWFNLFFIHQNHAPRGVKNSISEALLPKWLDFVVWGHEHACKVEPTPSAEGSGNFLVSQPGSSVQTTLSEDEAIPKKILLLELKGQNYRTFAIPLLTVRPFVFQNLALKDHPQLAERPEDQDAVQRFLHDAVTAAIAQANAQPLAQTQGAQGATAGGAAGPSAAPGEPQGAMLPLVRLRVDHSGGFPTVPLQRFGAPFQGRVANPWDLLQFHKAAQRRTGAGKKEHAAAGEPLAPEGGAQAGQYLAPELGDFRRIDALVAEHLPATLQILTEGDMAAALEEFVQHDEKGALEKAVKSALLESQRRVAAKGALGGEDAKELNQAINTSVREMKEASLAKRAANKEKKEASKASKEGAHAAADEAEEEMEMEPEPAEGAAAQPKAKAAKAAAKPRAKAGAAKTKQATLPGLLTGASAEGDTPRRVPARRAAAKKKPYADDSEDEEGGGGAARRGSDEEMEAEADGIESDEEDDAPVAKGPGRAGRGKAAAAPAGGRGRGRKAAGGSPAPRKRARADDVIVIDSGDDEPAAPPSKAPRKPAVSQPPPPSQAGTGGTAPSRGGWGSAASKKA